MACIIPGGIIQITGEHDVGKTSMALECGYHPNQIIFVEDDVKGKATVKQLLDDGIEFAKYIDFTEMIKDKSNWEVYQKMTEVLATVKKIVAENKDVKVLIWDTWSRVSGSFVEYVRKHPERFVEKNPKGNYWTGNSQIITGTQYKYAALHEAAILNELQKAIPLVFLVTHIKNNYDENGIKVGVKPDSSKTLNRVPYFRVWLRRNPDSQIPIALVMKRVNRKVFDENAGGLRTISILPPKIVPNVLLPEESIFLGDDLSLWDTISRYYRNPAGLRDLLPEEIPGEKENAILSGTMTKEQRISWIAALKSKRLFEQQEKKTLDIDRKQKAIEMFKGGEKNLSKIANDTGATLTDIIKWTS